MLLGKILLDNDDVRVAMGLLGGITVTVKARGIELKATGAERRYLLDLLEHLQRSGVPIVPSNGAVEEVVSDFAHAVATRGGALWNVFFALTPARDKVQEYLRANELDGLAASALEDVKSKWVQFNQTVQFKAEVSLAQKIDVFVQPIKEFIQNKYPVLLQGSSEIFWLTVFTAILESGTHPKEEVNVAIAELKDKYSHG